MKPRRSHAIHTSHSPPRRTGNSAADQGARNGSGRSSSRTFRTCSSRRPGASPPSRQCPCQSPLIRFEAEYAAPSETVIRLCRTHTKVIRAGRRGVVSRGCRSQSWLHVERIGLTTMVCDWQQQFQSADSDNDAVGTPRYLTAPEGCVKACWVIGMMLSTETNVEIKVAVGRCCKRGTLVLIAVMTRA
jgi:hypothetical protein